MNELVDGENVGSTKFAIETEGEEIVFVLCVEKLGTIVFRASAEEGRKIAKALADCIDRAAFLENMRRTKEESARS